MIRIGQPCNSFHPCRVTIPFFPPSPLFTLRTRCYEICYGPQVLSPTVFLLPMFKAFKLPYIINSAAALIFRSFSYSTCSVFYFQFFFILYFFVRCSTIRLTKWRILISTKLTYNLRHVCATSVNNIRS
jgi:hypothetical protein